MLWIPVDRSANRPLIRQVYEQLRDHILHGVLPAGTKLPSTRELAAALHVSRNVILEAYDQLQAEGYIESRLGSGTYVAQETYLSTEQPIASIPATEPPLSQQNIDFRSGLPALDHFPRKIWSRLIQQSYAQATPALLGYDRPEGRPELRQAITHYLLRTRGVRCDPEQVLITSGASQAFSLIARLLLRTRKDVLIEDPANYEVQLIYSSIGARLFPLPVDEQGMQTQSLPSLAKQTQPAFVQVTPSHQFPLGSILSIQRRIQLIQFAQETGCYIIEDDYDSEFRYVGTPVSAFQGLAPTQVIYIGTFSKSVYPALRLGYMILPPELVATFRKQKRITDIHSASLEQLALARFITEGHLERHIMQMKRLYSKRRATLINSLREYFGEQVRIIGDATGLHLVAEFPGMDFTLPPVTTAMQHAGVAFYPVEHHAMHKGQHCQQLILGYGNLTQAEIQEGVAMMQRILTGALEALAQPLPIS